jgi:hypothetical protein
MRVFVFKTEFIMLTKRLAKTESFISKTASIYFAIVNFMFDVMDQTRDRLNTYFISTWFMTMSHMSTQDTR